MQIPRRGYGADCERKGLSRGRDESARYALKNDLIQNGFSTTLSMQLPRRATYSLRTVCGILPVVVISGAELAKSIESVGPVGDLVGRQPRQVLDMKNDRLG